MALPEAESDGRVRRAGPRMKSPDEGSEPRKLVCVSFLSRYPGLISFPATLLADLIGSIRVMTVTDPDLGNRPRWPFPASANPRDSLRGRIHPT